MTAPGRRRAAPRCRREVRGSLYPEQPGVQAGGEKGDGARRGCEPPDGLRGAGSPVGTLRRPRPGTVGTRGTRKSRRVGPAAPDAYHNLTGEANRVMGVA